MQLVHKTQAMALATKHAGTIADTTISSIETIQKMAKWAVYGVMLTSYFHQMAYLFLNFPLHWKMDLVAIAHTLSYLIGILIIPLIFDALTVICIKVMGTVGFKQEAKTFAKRVIVIPALISAYINWMASDTLKIAIVYVLVVMIIPVMETLKTKSHEIDYDGIDAIERRTLQSVANAGVTQQDEAKVAAGANGELDPWVMLASMELASAQKIAGYEQMNQREKQSWSRKLSNTKRKLEADKAESDAKVQATV